VSELGGALRPDDEDRSAQPGLGPLNYSDLPGLEDVSLEDSFVREVVQDGATLRFILLAALLRDHPFYSGPRGNERHSFRPATLTFNDAEVKWGKRSQLRFIDAEGAVDLGNIDQLVAPAAGGYHIEGDWGSLDVVRSRAPVFLVLGESSNLRHYRRDIFRAWVRQTPAPAHEAHDGHAHEPPSHDHAGHDHAGHDHAGHRHPHKR
jgi:hypothetical protein